MRSSVVARLPWIAAGLIAGVWVAVVFADAIRTRSPRDFAPFYSAADVLLSRGPAALYDFAALAESQQRLFPEQSTPLPFLRPPFYALLFAPLRALAPDRALLAWMILNLAALGAGVYLMARAGGLELAAAAWHAAIFFPAVATFLSRQDVPLVFLAVAAALALAARGREFAAGAVLALAGAKFHLLLLVPLTLLTRRNWRATAGLASGGGLLASVSLLMVGPAGFAAYFRMLFDRAQPNIDPHPERIAGVWNVASTEWMGVGFVALAVAATALAARRGSLTEALAAACMGSVAVAPHVYISDYLLALPGCLLLAPTSRLSFASSLLLVFPVIPIGMVFAERAVLAAPVLAVLCLAGAAFRSTAAGSRA